MSRIASRAFTTVALALALTLLWVVGWYWQTAQEIADIWRRSDTFAHGLVVLPAFAWLVWDARERIGELQPQPVGWMALPILAAGLLWMLGGMVSVAAAQHFALFAMLVSAFVGVLGWRLSRVLLFPLVFLFFGLPIGEFMIPTLMHYTAEVTVWALRLSGVPVYQDGLHFVVPNGRWSVVEACSGIRYLTASLMVGALYAYLNYTSLKRRLLFMVVALIAPILANWLRAYMIVMMGYLTDNRFGAGEDHVFYGWILFGVVILAMFWIGARWHELRLPAAQVRAPATMQRAASWGRGLPLIIAIAIFPPVLKLLDTPVPDFPVRIAAPEPAAGWTTSLGPDIDYRPTYRGARADVFQAYAADGAALPVGFFAAWYVGQREGSEMIAWENGPTSPRQQDTRLVRNTLTLEVDGFTVRENRIATPAGRMLVWHWYRVNGRSLTRDAEVKLRLAFDRLRGMDDESAVVVLVTPEGRDDEEAARSRLEAFFRSHRTAIEAALDAPARSIPQ
ncbi:hypothetical protein CKCBHOJB_00979 [Thauera sp. GDN1]|uniref:exosortase A n=1 Tax=Thauera sp. GDN1 TaxID=2944810 RepID=UPI0024783610|nr:exosortase A [Thauera sp. GDN1]WEN41427.1 hypothetical protein CKCBHOJB_00979 [Thauera sp. GDN1]